MDQKTQQLDIPNTPAKFWWFVTRPYIGWALGATVLAGLASAMGQSMALFFKWIVDAVEAGDKDAALFYALLYPVAALIVQTIYRLSGFVGMHWVTRSRKLSYDSLAAYTLGHSQGYYANRFAGSILSKTNNIVSAIQDFTTSFLWTHLNAFIAFFVAFVFILSIDGTSGIIFVALIVTLIFFNLKMSPRKRMYSSAGAAAATKLRGSIVDAFTNASAVRQYAAIPKELDRIKGLSSAQLEAQKKNWLWSEKTMLANSAILFLFAMGMFYQLIERWRLDTISTGDFIFILALIAQITGTLIFIGRAIDDTARAVGEASEGLDDMIVPYEILDREESQDLVFNGGRIIWKDIVFEYGNNAVFDKFNLTIESGQRIGLVGPSGAGKTTFVSLLLREIETTSGEVLIDDQNIATVTQGSLRNAIAVVPQEPLLFHRSIKENIAYGKNDATDEEVVSAAKKAQAHEFIMMLEEGYDTLVGERGVKLSGGQKQRVAIARAILKDAPILILDEATSALDSESEVAVQKALHELMEGKTVIAVAHRLSTLKEMDRIIVLDHGQVTEDGSHDDLANAGGMYQRLWDHQAGGFLQE